MTIRRTAERVADGFTLLEGPRWHDGALWASDFFSHRVLHFDVADGLPLSATTVCIVPGQPSGLGFMPDGQLRISSMNTREVLGWNGKALDVVSDMSAFVTGPANDMAIDSAGITIIGNFGLNPERPREALPTALLRVDPDGTTTVAADDILFPNGIVIDERAGRLYVAETYRSRITVFDYAHGVLSNRRVWVEFSPDPGLYDIPAVTPALAMIPDGLCQDSEGALWVADAKGHGASRIADDGTLLDFVDTGDLSVYAVALGGVGRTDLYLCCAPPVETFDPTTSSRSALLRCRVDVPGV